jgi:hypothetical protein
MKRLLGLMFISAAAVTGAGCDIDDDDDDDIFDDDDDIDEDIDEANDDDDVDTFFWDSSVVGFPGYSTLVGSALVSERVGDTSFVADIDMRNDLPGSVRPWHVHFGTCATGGAIVGDPASYAPLVFDGNGAASATARVAFVLDPAIPYHINLHLSPSQLDTLIACGDLIPRGFGTP